MSSNLNYDRLAGRLLSIGLSGVLLTCALYAMASPAAALPELSPDFDRALAGAANDSLFIRSAGLVGIVGDLLFGTGALMLCRPGDGREPWACAGWAMIALCAVLFFSVDGIAAFALVQAATAATGGPAFIATKLLFNAMFFVGAVATGVGMILAFAGEGAFATGWLRLAGIGSGVACLAGVFAALTGFPSGQIIGLSIAASCLTGAILGHRISRGVRSVS